MIENLKHRIAVRKHDGNLDSGDVVQTVILIAGFVIIAILVVVWLGTAILNKGVDAGKCIEGSNTYTGSTEATAACSGSTATEGTNSFVNQDSYTSRY